MAETVVGERDVVGDVPRAEVVARRVARNLVAVCDLWRAGLASPSANIVVYIHNTSASR